MNVRSIPAGIAALAVALAVGFAWEMRGPASQPANADAQPSRLVVAARELLRGDRLDAALSRGDRLDAARRGTATVQRGRTAAFMARFANAFVRDVAGNDAAPQARPSVARRTAPARVAAAPTRSIFPPDKHTRLASLGPRGNGAANDEAAIGTALAYAPAQASAAPTRSIVPPEKNARVASLGPSSVEPSSPALDDLDGHTAIYDITAHTIYLPGGEKLEAHSGLGSHIDDPHSVSLRNRGVTPPNVYRLTLREHLFHGVRALRLVPVGDGNMYGRDGILAHTYMLGPNGQSNGCMSVRNYPAFLDAFMSGKVERLLVVDHMKASSPRIASLLSRL
ncbi:MAG TPA: DUF2778 domain-containing protein [Xanthobacteraceae bacterium]|jgi:hypothetical protein